MPTVIVTGGAGFIGSHTVEQLLDSNLEVVVYDDFTTGTRSNLAHLAGLGSLRIVEGDVTDSGTLQRVFREAKPLAVIHLAALVSVQESIVNPALNFRLNVLATQCVAQASIDSGIPRVVFASSAAVYGANEDCPLRENGACEPISPYGAAKLASEVLLSAAGKCYNLEIVCLRYFNVFGPRQLPTSPYSGVISRFVGAIKNNSRIQVFGDGQQTRDFIHVRDLARANVSAATAAPLTSGIYNVCGSRQLSLRQLVDTFNGIVPGLPDPEYLPPRSGDIRRSCGDATKFSAATGWRPTENLSDSLREMLEN